MKALRLFALLALVSFGVHASDLHASVEKKDFLTTQITSVEAKEVYKVDVSEFKTYVANVGQAVTPEFLFFFSAVLSLIAYFTLSPDARKGIFYALPHYLYRVVLFILGFGPKQTKSLGAFLGQIPLSATGSFTITYLPQYIGFTATTVPTNFQIEMNGEPMLFSLDGNGLNSMTHIRQVARVANQYIFQLADGLINGKNCVFTVTNAMASALDIYGWSPVKKGYNLYEYSRLTTLAGATSEIADFAYLSFPSAAAGDKWQVAYNDGSVDNLNRDELNYNLGYTQGLLTSQYNIDNINPARVSRVFFTTVAQQTHYKMGYRPL